MKLFFCVYVRFGGRFWGPWVGLVTLCTQRTEGRYRTTGSLLGGVVRLIIEGDPGNFGNPRGDTVLPKTW